MQIEVPEGWEHQTLGTLFKWASGKKPPFPKALAGPVPIYGSNGILGYGPKANVERVFLVGRVGASGSLHVVMEPSWANDNTLVARPISEGADFSYLGHLLSSLNMPSYATQTAQPLLTQSRLKPVAVPLPPLPEQRKIAAILSSVDEAIAATEQVIEQTRRVKEGLLQELLTRGIGHTRFKQTPIGEIPESWEVVLVDSVATRGSGHTPSKKHPEYWNGGIRWVSLTDSQALDRVYIEATDKEISSQGIANSSAVLHPPGFVLVSRDASVGRSAITTTDMAVSQHFIGWTCGPSLNNHFLYYFLQSHKLKFERIAVGSTIKTIGLGYFKKLRLGLPPRSEQDAIAERLLTMDKQVWGSETGLNQLHRTKAGLLQDLLTGKVRVSV